VTLEQPEVGTFWRRRSGLPEAASIRGELCEIVPAEDGETGDGCVYLRWIGLTNIGRPWPLDESVAMPIEKFHNEYEQIMKQQQLF